MQVLPVGQREPVAAYGRHSAKTSVDAVALRFRAVDVHVGFGRVSDVHYRPRTAMRENLASHIP